MSAPNNFRETPDDPHTRQRAKMAEMVTRAPPDHNSFNQKNEQQPRPSFDVEPIKPINKTRCQAAHHSSGRHARNITPLSGARENAIKPVTLKHTFVC